MQIKNSSLFKHKKLSLAVSVALIASASAANALMIEDSITVEAEASAPGSIPDMTSGSDNTPPVSVSTFASTGGAISGGSAFARGTGTGTYVASADTYGAGSAKATVSWTRIVTNDEADPLNIFLDAFIYGGRLNISEIGQVASYDWDITATGPNGSVSILDSNASIDGVSITEGGADGGLDTDNDDDPFFYDWDSRTINDFALGQLLPGEMLTIQYDLMSSIDGSQLDLQSVVCDPFIDEYGGPIDVAFVEEGYGGCFANAFTGDPGGITQVPFQVVGVPVPTGNPIPEPGSLALLGAGALGATAARRRKKKSEE